MEKFNREALERFDGEGGPAYVAFAGKVYDVSASRLWKGGRHVQRHRAGKDLTAELGASPHDARVLSRFPQVGLLEAPASPPPAPVMLAGLLQRWPLLRRHPHPALVHYPIAFFTAAGAFLVVHLLTGRAPFETTSMHCLGAGLIFTPAAMLSGFLTWRVNYGGRPMRKVTLKIILSLLMLAVSLSTFAWRMASGFPGSLPYTAGVLVLAPLAWTVAFIGGTLSFPIQGNEAAGNPDTAAAG